MHQNEKKSEVRNQQGWGLKANVLGDDNWIKKELNLVSGLGLGAVA